MITIITTPTVAVRERVLGLDADVVGEVRQVLVRSLVAALERQGDRDAHRGYQEWIFAVRFLKAAEARVRIHLQNG